MHGLVFILLVLISAGCTREALETANADQVDEPSIESVFVVNSTEGPRQPTGLKYVKAGWTYACMECHASIDAKWHYDRLMVEHRDLELKHGTNSFCLNCHHPENRNAYVHYDGSEISADAVELLCRKCHGPQFRDWEKGIHGRLRGYWNAELGLQGRLKCTQCHDPHDPAFKPMPPMAAPTYPERASGGLKHSNDEQEEEGSHHG